MGKLEDELKLVKTQVNELKQTLNQVSFNIIRVMGTLDKSVAAPTKDGGKTDVKGTVAVDLGPLEERIERIEKSLATKEELTALTGKVDLLASEKLKHAESLQVRATNLLEKGMELVELEGLLMEIKTLLEQRIIGDEGKEEGE